MVFLIEYSFKDGGPLYKEILPESNDQNNSIFLVKGKNDLGKTTVLNMVALGLYGLDSTDIDNKLKSKMKYLISDHPDDCNFNFKIIHKHLDLELESVLKNKEIHTFYNGQEVGKDFIENKVKILYDIPDDPAIKLDSAVRLIKANINDYLQYLDRHRQNIQTRFDKINDFLEKEDRIKKLREDFERNKEALNNYNTRLSQINEDLIDLRKNYIVFKGVEDHHKIEALDKQKDQLTRLLTQCRKKGAEGGTDKYKKKIGIFRIALIELKSKMQELENVEKYIDKSDFTKLKGLIGELNKIDNPKQLSEKRLKGQLAILTNIMRNLDENPLNKIELIEEKQNDLFQKMSDLLQQFIEINIEIPGTEGKTINQFIAILERSQRKLRPKVVEKQDFLKEREIVSDFYDKFEEFFASYKDIPDSNASELPDTNAIRLNIQKIEKDTNDVRIGVAKYIDEMKQIPKEEIEKILESGKLEEDYLGKVKLKSDLERKITEKSTKIISIEKAIHEIDQLTEPTEYNKDELISRLDTIDSIIHKLSSWRKYLESIDIQTGITTAVKSPESEKFFDALSDYFADILKVIYFEKQQWKVIKVDLFNRCYIIEGRKPIAFPQIGTGHSNLNSLLTRLKQDFSGRKKVVLIDEIGHMDEENLNILLNEIKSQVRDGKIIFALLTRADNKLNRVKWIPISETG